MDAGRSRKGSAATMAVNALAELDPSQQVLKRAQYEAFTFALLDGDVLVRNESYADPENHEYRVEIEEGLPTSCECPADVRYPGACKHRVAVAIRRPILEVAIQMQVVADGRDRSVSNQGADAEPEATGCEHLTEDFPCWECVRTGRRTVPSQE